MSTWMLWILVYTYCHVMTLKLHGYIPESYSVSRKYWLFESMVV